MNTPEERNASYEAARTSRDERLARLRATRLAKAITVDEAHEIERKEVDGGGCTWWQAEDDPDSQAYDLGDLLHALCDSGYDHDNPFAPNWLPDYVELVIGSKPTIDVYELLFEQWEDLDGDHCVEFDTELVAAAQVAMDAALASCPVFLGDKSVYVDIRSIRDEAYAEYMRDE